MLWGIYAVQSNLRNREGTQRALNTKCGWLWEATQGLLLGPKRKGFWEVTRIICIDSCICPESLTVLYLLQYLLSPNTKRTHNVQKLLIIRKERIVQTCTYCLVYTDRIIYLHTNTFHGARAYRYETISQSIITNDYPRVSSLDFFDVIRKAAVYNNAHNI